MDITFKTKTNQPTQNQINNIKKSQNQIKNEEYIINFNDDTLKYSQTPIGKALVRGRGRPPMAEEDKAKPSDRVKCDLCGHYFIRSNRSSHKKTEKHRLYLRVNKKMAKLVLDN